MTAAAVDHIVFLAARLDEGAAWLEERLGARFAGGGQHVRMGTHNRVMRLGDWLYLELIAIDPSLPAPGRPRWFALDEPEMQGRLRDGPQLVTWLARVDNIEEAAARMPVLGPVSPMSRGDFEWLVTISDDGGLCEGGFVPAIISWQAGGHPADNLPESGVSLLEFQLRHPEPARIAAALTAIGFEQAEAAGMTAYAAEAHLHLSLQTPNGRIEFSSLTSGQ